VKSGDLVKIEVAGYNSAVPAIDEISGAFAYIPKGAHAVYLGHEVGQQTLGGGARIMWQGRQMLVLPKAIGLVQPTHEVV
jgi:hypothetical protein